MLLSARAIWHFFLIMAFEVSIINALRGLADTAPAVNAVMRFTAAYLPYAAVPALFIFVVRRLGLGKRQTLFVLLFAALSVALAETGLVVLHELLPRARPFAALQFEPLVAVSRALASFPSGHASVLFALAFSAFAFDKLTGWLLVAVAALNGFARIYAGVHWPTDIIGGALLGGAAFGAVYLLLQDARKALILGKLT